MKDPKDVRNLPLFTLRLGTGSAQVVNSARKPLTPKVALGVVKNFTRKLPKQKV